MHPRRGIVLCCVMDWNATYVEINKSSHFVKKKMTPAFGINKSNSKEKYSCYFGWLWLEQCQVNYSTMLGAPRLTKQLLETTKC